MKRASVALSAMVLAPLAPAFAAEPPLRFATPYASPSSVIAAEIEFGRLMRERGYDGAIKETAAVNAIAFVPEFVKVRDRLKSRTAPPVPVMLETQEVWSSCDGSYVVARGAWRGIDNAAVGSFVTLWQRQPKNNYKWLLDVRSTAAAPTGTSDMIAGKVAPCPSSPQRGRQPSGDKRDRKPRILQPDIDPQSGRSDDATLHWSLLTTAGGDALFIVSVPTSGERGAAEREVMRVPVVPRP